MRTRGVMAVLLLGFAGACGSRHQQPPETVVHGDGFSMRIRRDMRPVTGDLRVSADTVWKALPSVFGSLGFPSGKSVSPEERFFATKELTVTARLYEGEPNSLYFDCGPTPAGSPAADEYVVVFSILARVVPDGDQLSHLDVVVDGRARDRNRSNASAKFCSGTGRLEQMVIDAVKRRLSA